MKNPSLPPIKELFRESWDAFVKSILNLLILSVISIVAIILIGVVTFILLFASGVFNAMYRTVPQFGIAAVVIVVFAVVLAKVLNMPYRFFSLAF